jgi:hypothetical protein
MVYAPVTERKGVDVDDDDDYSPLNFYLNRLEEDI